MVGRMIRRMSAEPERAVFALATGALVVAGVKRSRRVETVAKPLIMLSVQAGLWRTRTERSRGDNALLAVASTAALAGDWLMMEEEFAPTEAEADSWIVRGASAFAVNHAATVTLALKRGARPRPVDFALRAAGLIEGLALLTTRRSHLLKPLGTYSALLGGMSAVMASPQLPRELELGGLSFLASDATILHRRIFLEDARSRAAAEAFVLASYCLAQRKIFDGLASASGNAPARR